MEHFFPVLQDIFAIPTLLSLFFGLLIGYIVGVLPGLNRVAALAIALPFTYHLAPLAGIALLIGVSKGGTAGGAITSILLNTPGEPSSAATCLDGYPLSRQGKSRKALGIALYSAFFGDFFATMMLILLAAPLAKVALKLGPLEIFSILIFSLTFIAALSGKSMLKGLIGGALGIFVSCTGLDVESAMPRLTFGFMQLFDGVPMLAIGVGILALSEMMIQMETSAPLPGLPLGTPKPERLKEEGLTWKELIACWRTLFRSSFIGTIIGILPGLGGTIGAFLGYSMAKRASKHPERYGKGELEGVAAAEAADNAVTASAFIPLFALGIPGSVAAAMLIAALTVHGVSPGPLMFEQHTALVYGIYGIFLLASFLMLPVGQLGLRFFSLLTLIRDSILCPVVVLLCLFGALLEGKDMFSVWMVIIFGILGYLMKKMDLSFVTFLIGFILGPMIELKLRQSMLLMQGDWSRLTDHPVAIAFVLFAVVAAQRLSKVSQLK